MVLDRNPPHYILILILITISSHLISISTIRKELHQIPHSHISEAGYLINLLKLYPASHSGKGVGRLCLGGHSLVLPASDLSGVSGLHPLLLLLFLFVVVVILVFPMGSGGHPQTALTVLH